MSNERSVYLKFKSSKTWNVSPVKKTKYPIRLSLFRNKTQHIFNVSNCNRSLINSELIAPQEAIKKFTRKKFERISSGGCMTFLVPFRVSLTYFMCKTIATRWRKQSATIFIINKFMSARVVVWKAVIIRSNDSVLKITLFFHFPLDLSTGIHLD